jgi:hypothetical protein
VEALLGEGFCGSGFYGTLLAIHEKQGRIDSAELGRRINARLESSAGQEEEAAAFMAGVFFVGRDVVFTEEEILKEIDKVVAFMDDDSFLTALPHFRYAFTSFLPAETDRLGKMVAALYDMAPEEIRRGELVTQEELVLALTADKKAEAALEKWGLL